MRELVVSFTGSAGAELTGNFAYLPFAVPAWAKTIEVRYNYRGHGACECAVDVGLFEPSSLELIEAMSSFRGWSGSSKRHFYVPENSATPGYIPGPLKPGV